MEESIYINPDPVSPRVLSEGEMSTIVGGAILFTIGGTIAIAGKQTIVGVVKCGASFGAVVTGIIQV